jgi:hypothetical protein
MQTTREKIREFNRAFGRPFNRSLTHLSVQERILLGKLLLEETVEYVTKGLGLKWQAGCYDVSDEQCYTDDSYTELKPGFLYLSDVDAIVNIFDLEADESKEVDPVECADGLGDVNVVIHFCAHWQGFNLDRVTDAINESNMSKLGADGKPIINECINAALTHHCPSDSCLARDQSKPIGKILKGPNFKEPTEDIKRIIYEENNNAE